MGKLVAEFAGTAALVLIGCGAAVLGGYASIWPGGILPIAFAFGLAVMAMAYAIGAVSGCHINPAVTLGFVASGRMQAGEAIGYVIAQVIGGVFGALVLYLIATGKIGGYDVAKGGLGQNGWGEGYLGGYGPGAAFLTEVVATFIFVAVILRATRAGGAGVPLAGLVIGLTLVVIHITFINVTGVSVNPARSVGPAFFVGGTAIGQLWLFIVAPLIGGALAGIVDKMTGEQVTTM